MILAGPPPDTSAAAAADLRLVENPFPYAIMLHYSLAVQMEKSAVPVDELPLSTQVLPELSAAPRIPLLTSWSTMLYIDTSSGELRHGSVESGLALATLAIEPTLQVGPQQGMLVYETDHGLDPLICSAESSGIVSRVGQNGGAVTFARFEVLSLERNLIGLRSAGLYLCAEPDGRVTLSRTICSTWETFVAAEIRSASLHESARETRHASMETDSSMTLSPVSPPAPRFSSVCSWLQSEIPVLVPCFNNPTYTRNMLAQLRALGFRRLALVDNASTSPDMRNWLLSLGDEAAVIALSQNLGPHHAAQDPRILALFPRYYCITDPDLAFNPSLPADFLGDLAMLTERYGVGKAGFALDISDREAMRDDLFEPSTGLKIWEWEAHFWDKPLEPLNGGDCVYDADIDTTFALYDKEHFDPADFYRAVRVAGRFTARHLPWYRDSGLTQDEAESYVRTQSYSSYMVSRAPRN